MAQNNTLYTIRSWYEAKKKTGLILMASANLNGRWESVKIYVPYNSRYEDSPTSRKPAPGHTGAMVIIPTEKVFEEDTL